MARHGVGLTSVEISLLGKQRVAADGSPLDGLRSGRTFGLLAYLVVHRGASQLRQHLAGVFWPDSTDSQARTNLRRELHQLREALPEPDRFLNVDAQTVTWCEDARCTSDVVEFETALAEANSAQTRNDTVAFRLAAERAVRLYGGDLLPGFYDDWVLAERERLRRSCVALLDRLATVLAELGDTRTASEHARRRVELEPLEESGYRRLMELQGRTGDRAAALATFHRCASTLQHELQVEPCAETVAVFRRLITQTATPVAATPHVPRDAPLIGRTAELGALQSARANAAVGPRLMVVVGEAGIGKTRVAAELADEVRRGGGIVAHAHCYASKGRVALAPVAEWLRSPALRAGLDRLDAVWRPEVARLVPELGAGERTVPPEPLADAWQRRRFLEGLVRAMLAGEKETLLVLDDLQWCDGETLAWLELLVHHQPPSHLLVVATLRAEERGDNPELTAFCRRLRAVGILRELELAPLAAEDSAEIAAALLDHPLDDEAAHRLQADTGGVPLFVVEAARQGSVRSPRVEAVLANRIAQLSPAARQLAGVAAAVGREFSLELLEAATDVDDETFVSAVDELWRRRLLRERAGTIYDFSHDLLRDAAYEALSPPHRYLLHRRIAEALERLHADRLASVAALVADQRERGGQPDRAIRFYTLAAEAAAAVFALEGAVRHHRRALGLIADLEPGDERDRRELALRQAMVGPLNALQGYSSSELGACLERAVELGEQLAEDAIVVRSRVALWAHHFVRGRIDASLALGEGQLTRIPDHPDLAGVIHLSNAGSLASLGRPAEALDHFRNADERVGSDDVWLFAFHVRVMVLAWRAHALWLVGRSDEAAASADAALALADELERPYDQAVAQAYAAITHHLLGDTERTAELAASVRTLCDRYGFGYYGDWGRILEGWVTGGATGEALIRQGIDRLRSLHAATRLPFYLALLADVLGRGGRSGEAARLLGEARSLAEAHGDRWWLAELWRLEAGFHPDDEAEAMLRRACSTARDHGSRALELRAATDLARRWLEAGRSGEAEALLGPVAAKGRACNPADVAAADALLADAAGSPVSARSPR
jgi:DNA-binding SARP family transcriptional activator